MASTSRMYVEGPALVGETPRAAVQRIMGKFDQVAAANGRRITGDVTIAELDPTALAISRTYRLEADVEPAT